VLIAQRPTLSEDVVDEFRSRFVIEPLEPGFGYTLGNSLRRTLLSSIPGASVTSIKVDSVLHEFSTIEGVKEDVTEVILNLKGLVVSSEHDEPVTMYLRKQGPGDVTAADIAPPAGVEVHNTDLKIATLNDKGKLEMELVVERGRGYVSSVQNKAGDVEIGRMPVDSIYSPVLKVTYHPCRAAHRLRQARHRRRDQAVDPSPRRDRLGRQDPRRAVRPRPRAERRGRGHRHRPVAGGRAACCRPRASGRGPAAHRAFVQLPQA
jgi:DNA-directed RNA polymerase alpha subunit